MVLEKLLSRHAQLRLHLECSTDGLSLPVAPPIESEQWLEWQAVKAPDGPIMQDEACTWQDWALLYGAEIMQQMRTAIQHRLGLTCSAVSTLANRVFEDRARL